MTTTDLAVLDDETGVDVVGTELAAVVKRLLAEAPDPATVIDVMARIEAAKAWAKVHKKIKDIRLDLLDMEVAALVRLIELGGVELLPAKDREAAEWLAALCPGKRSQIIAESRSATTAAGLFRSVREQAEREAERETQRLAGAFTASNGGDPTDSVPASALRAQATKDVGEILSRIIETHTDTGQPFTVEDVTDELLVAARADVDEDFQEGVREIVRRAIRSAPSKMVDGTLIPKLLTVRLANGSFVRIPTINARVADLDDALEFRREQLRQDEIAFERLEEFVGRVKAIPGAISTDQVGDLIASTLMRRSA